MPSISKHQYLRLILRGDDKDLIFPVEEKTSGRLQEVLKAATRPAAGFFWFDTLSGRSVIVNLQDVQAVRYLWELGPYVRSEPDEDADLSLMKLRGKEPLPLGWLEDRDELLTLYAELETDATVNPFPAFLDEDGEVFQFSASDLVWLDICVTLVSAEDDEDATGESTAQTSQPLHSKAVARRHLKVVRSNIGPD